MMGTRMRSLRRRSADVAEAWHRFWFAPSDPLPLCVLRILVGMMLVYTHWVWGFDLMGFFGDNGWNNAGVLEALQQGTLSWSLWWWVPHGWEFAFHYLCLLVLVLFCIGCWTRVTAVLAWMITVSYAHRSMLANFGLDQVNAAFTFYLMLAPCGARLSLDRWWQTTQLRPGLEKHAGVTLATRLIQIHLCVIYVWAGLSKLQGSAWWTGDAIWQVLANREYQSLDLTWMAAYPIVLQLLTHGVPLFELTFPFAMLDRRTRALAMFAGAAMHVGIGMFLGMWTFGLTMIFGYLSYVNADTLRRCSGRGVRVLERQLRRRGVWRNAPALDVPATVGSDIPLALRAPPSSSDGGIESSPLQSTTARATEDDTQSLSIPAPSLPVSVPEPEFVPPVRIAPQSLPPKKTAEHRTRFVTDELIYVARSSQQRANVRAYFRRHQIPCLVLRGAAEMIEKTINRRKSTIVLRAKDFSAGELQYWIDELVQTNPDGQFRVLLLPDVRARGSSDGLNVPPGVRLLRLSASTTLRRVRKLYGNQDWNETPTDVQPPLGPRQDSGIRRAKLMSWLLLCMLLAGCGTRRDAPRVQLERARMMLERGQLHESIQAFTAGLSSSKGTADDYYDRGVAYERLGQLEQAAADYSEALRLAPSHSQALNNRGVVLAQLGRVDEAITDLSKAVEKDPQDALAWSNRGLAHHESQNYVDAIADYSQALFLSKEARLYFQRGNVYVDFGKLEQAVADFTAAINMDDSLVRAFVNRGNARAQLGRYDEAIADLRHAGTLDRDLSLNGAIEQLEQRIRGQRWQPTAVSGLQPWLATQGYELRVVPAEADGLSEFTIHRTGEALGIPCLLMPTGPRGAPVFEYEKSEELTQLGSDVALFVVDKQTLVETTPNATAEQPEWLKDWRFQWRPLPSDFAPSQVEVLLGPAAD